MYLAWQHAAKADPDFYLWLNDDTYVLKGCLQKLLDTWGESVACGRESCIVVASCRDPDTGAHSYGGVMRARRPRSEEHTSELQSLRHLVCRLLLEKNKSERSRIQPRPLSGCCLPPDSRRVRR